MLEMAEDRTEELIIDADWLFQPALQKIFDALTAEGATVRVVGGAVRDTLEQIPVKDIDIAIDVEPLKTIRLLENAKIKVVPTGIEYGTVSAILEGKAYQITTLRQDIETYGRKADVEFVMDWEADAMRRDFTINAIYANPDGTLYDPCHGVSDLKNGDVRFIGNAQERVQEDYLRILRFFRFSGRFSPYFFDAEAIEACHKYAPKISTLSKERITEEFFKILTLETPSDVLVEMGPELGEIFSKPLKIESLLELEYFEVVWDLNCDVLLRLASLIDSLDDIRLLQLSKEQIRFLNCILQYKNESSIDHRFFLYKYGKDITRGLLTLIVSRDPRRLYPRVESLLDECEIWESVKLPIGGEDLMALGVPQGKQLGDFLEKIERWWIRKDFKPDRKESIAYAERLLKSASAS